MSTEDENATITARQLGEALGTIAAYVLHIPALERRIAELEKKIATAQGGEHVG